MLGSPANSGVGESNLANDFFRLKNGSTKGSLGRVHIVDDGMEVERKMRVQGVAGLLDLGAALQKANSAKLRFPVDARLNMFFHQASCEPMGSPTCKIAGVDVCF